MDKENKMIHGSISEEIQRLIKARNENGMVAPMLTSLVISFTQFVLGLIVFGTESEEMPTTEDIWGIMNGSNLPEHVRLMHSLQSFLPVWLDTQKPGYDDWIEADSIIDAYNKFVIQNLGE